MPPAAQFTAIVPIKTLARAKTRLHQLPRQQRVALARAFALDTVSALMAARSVAEVWVATDEASLISECGAAGAVCIPDGGRSLNESLRQAAIEVERRGWAGAVFSACADLPALRPAELDEVLAQAAHRPSWFVPDAQGSGTTLYGAHDLTTFRPAYGAESARAHLDSGAEQLLAPHRLRRDVDTLDDLEAARELGVGSYTRSALGRAGGRPLSA